MSPMDLIGGDVGAITASTINTMEPTMKIMSIPDSARSVSSVSDRVALAAQSGVGSSGIVSAVKRAKADMDELCDDKDIWVQLEIEAIRALSFNFDGLVPEGVNEVYVTGWIVDASGRADARTTSLKVGVKKGDLIDLESNNVGTPIAKLKNPEDYIYWGFVVMESDEKTRTTATKIKAALENNGVEAMLQAAGAATGNSIVSAVTNAATALGGLILDLIAQNGDDTMLTEEGGGLRVQGFNAHDPGEAENTQTTYCRTRYAVHLYSE